VAQGLVVADSFTGLRALLTPANRKTQVGRRHRREPVYGMEAAGRWSILERSKLNPAARQGVARVPIPEGTVAAAEAAELLARLLLKRYGVVFKKLLEREGLLLPWRVLLRVYHRLEARGEIRGGRFVAGISGEQFALPEAVGMLRAVRRARTGGNDLMSTRLTGSAELTTDDRESLISISAADPLNLLGITTPGTRIAAHTANRILYHNGEPIAVRESGETKFLVQLSRTMEWKAKTALLRRPTPPQLRTYLRRPA
jgi:ATP-dependent Lhr-like helicase